MNWKTRQLFSDREHGIVSGLSPVNMTGGGSVPMPGYEDGGVLPQLSNNYHTHPELHSHSTDRSGGLLPLPGGRPRPEDIQLYGQKGMQGGGTVEPGSLLEWSTRKSSMPFDEAYNLMQALSKDPTISISDADKARMERAFILTGEEHIFYRLAKGTNYQPSTQFKNTVKERVAQQVGDQEQRVPNMQAGGLALDLFEEGDQEINEPLNMMAQAVSPSIADITPTAPTGATETIEETVTVTEDQGSGEYQVELQALKEAFLNDIRFYATNSGTTELGEYLKKMNIAYFNELEKLKEKHGIEGITTGEELITNEFLQELMSIANPEATSEIPAFENGGVVGSAKEIKTKEHLLALGINVPLHIWEKLSDERKDLIFSEQMARNIFGGAGTTAPDTSRLDALLARREGLAGDIGKATRGSYSSYLPRVLHYGAAKRAGQLAEAEAMDKVLADQIATERTLLGTTGRGSSERLGQQWKDAFSGVTKQPDTLDMYKTAIKDFQDEGFVGNVRALAIIALADDFAPPPRALAIYQGTVTLPTGETLTWPEFYHKFKQATLDRHLKTLQDQGSKLTSIEHGSDEYYDALMPLILQWQKAVSKSQ